MNIHISMSDAKTIARAARTLASRVRLQDSRSMNAIRLLNKMAGKIEQRLHNTQPRRIDEKAANFNSNGVSHPKRITTHPTK